MSIIKYILYSIKNKSLRFEIRRRILLPLACKDIQARADEGRRLAYKKLYRKYHKTISSFRPSSQATKKKSDYIWIFWESGYKTAPELVKSCIHSVRRVFRDKKVVMLSADNLDDYIQLPDYIKQKHKSGKIKAAHYSDLVRLELLCRHGGIWLDSTVLCTSEKIPKYITDPPLFVFKSLCLRREAFQNTRCSNWCISSESNNDLLVLTRNLLLLYWKDFDYAIDYFIMHMFLAMASRRFPEQWDAIPTYNNHTPHTMMFELRKPYTDQRWRQLLDISPLHKLERHTDFSRCRGTIYNKILSTYGVSNEAEN